MNHKPLVSVVMITYGHENYIREAIEGVLMQECDFCIELIIANDASPDSTDEIIQTLIESHLKSTWIKYVKHEKNIGMMPNFIYALQQCEGKYIALCDGDDYWIDSLKLRKQVDFLETNSEYAYCGHKSSTNCEGVINKLPLEVKSFSFKELIFENFLNTSTLLIRKSVIKDLPDFFGTITAGDWALQLIAVKNSKAYILPDYMSVYRIHENGVWSSLDNKIKCLKGVQTQEIFKEFYSDKASIYIIDKAIKERKKRFGSVKISCFKKIMKKIKSKLNNKYF
ncbi:glycosyltransferase [Flavobacterium sufflavum]|uniref:Glycosyltransferase n=1 Tax=Flavobacterium sufflavum TaxID=1921138 RepID=A0A3S2V480_9FLAO|nr:glycosyltransferase [Flavobacterium sufflavum]RVT75872.1 glycosyltransferase [Flavobacterium sufflavum]